ncbi:MAG TPA: hypothetical protein VFQ07_09100 [Candidatus Polarisedimenticolia bacterium]|nr:hypothetical protein [Candidatus Polarisedimenticolia bacterium]
MRHAFVLAPALLLAASSALAGPSQAAPKGWPEGVQSPDDRGFAIVLTSPVDPWLHGRQTLRVETMIPRDDTVDQVDFFVDRHLVFVDTDEPYTTTFEFGPEIRRHTIEVKALTHEGRRARVSFVSRSADLAENAPGRVVTFAAMVRDTAGQPVDRLDVSDFAVSEGTVPQSIVHFLAAPAPASIAIVVDPAVADAAREAVVRFLRQLPPHQALAVFGPAGASGPAAPGGDAAGAGETEASLHRKNAAPEPSKEAGGKAAPAPPRAEPSPFTYDVASIVSAFDAPKVPEPEAVPAESHALNRRSAATAPAPPWPELAARAAAALAARPGPRLLIVIAPVAPAGDEPLGPPLPAALQEAKSGRKDSAVPAVLATGKATPPGAKTPAVETDPLTAAIEAARRSGASLRVLALPAPADRPWSEAKGTERALEQAAADTGGAYDAAFDGAAIARALENVTETLRHQYIVSYVTTPDAHAGWKPLEVVVRGRDRAVEAPRSVFLGDPSADPAPAKEPGNPGRQPKP